LDPLIKRETEGAVSGFLHSLSSWFTVVREAKMNEVARL
jgi:hypothetical protein